MPRATLYLIRILRKDIALYVSAAVLALCFAMPLFTDEMIFGYTPIKMSIDSAASIMKENVASGAFKDLPPDERANFDKQAELLEQAASARSKASFYKIAARCYAIQLKEMDAGYMTTDLRVHTEAEYRFCHAMARKGAPDFETSSQMPLVSHLSYAACQVPAIIWLLPAFVFLLRAGELSRENLLLANLPVSASRLFVARCLAGALIVCLALLAAYAPAAILSLARNGLGDPARPVFFARDGALAASTALGCYAGTAATLLLGNLFIVVAGLGVGAAARSAAAGTAAALACAGLPMVEIYHATSSPLFGVLPYLPSTYLSFQQMPFSGCWPMGWGDAGVDGRLDPLLGLAVLAAGAAAVASAALLLMSVRRRRGERTALAAEGSRPC